MKKPLSLAALAAVGALVAMGSLGGAPAVESFAQVTNSGAQHQPAQPNKSAPGDTKTNRLRSGFYGGRTHAPRGKRVSRTVAQDRRHARKARNVKRHRA